MLKLEAKFDGLPTYSSCLSLSLFHFLTLAHVAGVNSLIWVIFAAGNRVNNYFRQSNGLISSGRQLPSNV